MTLYADITVLHINPTIMTSLKESRIIDFPVEHPARLERALHHRLLLLALDLGLGDQGHTSFWNRQFHGAPKINI